MATAVDVSYATDREHSLPVCTFCEPTVNSSTSVCRVPPRFLVFVQLFEKH
eukprot:SAG31_NODE_30032_length_386_cov_0.888502_1_plen_50_part_10